MQRTCIKAGGKHHGKILIGWAEESIVPEKKGDLAGQFFERISEYVESEITVTAMAVESEGEQMILVSADVVSVNGHVLECAREKFAALTDEVDAKKLIVCATHTHTSMRLSCGNSENTFKVNKAAEILNEFFELYKDSELAKIKETKNYKDSLFVIQLSEIIKCANTELSDISIEKAYVYNDIRSVIENLCYLLNPKYVDNDDKYNVLKELFDIESTEYMKLDYIVNNNSHNEPMLNIERWFEPHILHEACKVISDMVKDKFNQLYNYCLNLNNDNN